MTNTIDEYLGDVGKIPPQNIESEVAVLGGCLLESDGIHEVISILGNEKCFYKDAHGNIFNAIIKLYNNHDPIDLITVADLLEKDRILEESGGRYYLTELTENISGIAHIRKHCYIILEKYFLRTIILYSSKAVNDSYDGKDPFEIIDRSYDYLNEIAAHLTGKSIMSMPQLMENTRKHIKDITNTDNHVTGIDTGFKDLNKFTAGFQRADFIIIAARPGVGKSTVMVALAKNMAKKGYKPIVFSLEMTDRQLTMRIISSETKVSLERMIRGSLNEREQNLIEKRDLETIKNNLEIIDHPGIGVLGIRSTTHRLMREKGIDIIFIDYIQLMKSNSSKHYNREQEVSFISRNLKGLAKDLDIPVVALAQLSRAVEIRGGDKHPQLSDLRESGCLSVETSHIYTYSGVLSNVNSRIYLLSLNRDKNKITQMDSKNIPRKPREVFRLKLQSGRFLDCTANHPILTTDGYKQLKHLKLTDSVACAMLYPDDGRYIYESKFIGWMLGNGCMYGYNVPSFITNDKVIADKFCQFICDKFGFFPKDHPHYQSNVYQYDCTNSPTGNRTKEGNKVTAWLKENDLWGRKAKDKYIPEWFIEKANNQSILELLQGLWETDGSVAIGKIRQVISYSTTSNYMGYQILFLLSKVGIFAHIDDGYLSVKATTPCFKIVINNYIFQKVFMDLIKLDGYKGEKLKKITVKINSGKYTDKLGRGTTEEIASVCKPPCKLRIQLHDGRRMTKSHLKKLLIFYQNSSLLKKYEWLATDSIVWDSIDSIDSIGIKEIFDRNVPETNNFIVNGIIVHNSLEQDADLVIFLYRPEYYNISEDSEGNSTEGVMEAIIAKNRQGRTGTVTMKFIGKYTEVTDGDELYIDDEGEEKDAPF